MKNYNDILFLYCYFKGLETSVHTDPHEVKYNGKNYVFRESHNDLCSHIVTYEFDDDIKAISIEKEYFKIILEDRQTKEHAKIGQAKLK